MTNLPITGVMGYKYAAVFNGLSNADIFLDCRNDFKKKKAHTERADRFSISENLSILSAVRSLVVN